MKEVALHGGDIHQFVDPLVAQAIAASSSANPPLMGRTNKGLPAGSPCCINALHA